MLHDGMRNRAQLVAFAWLGLAGCTIIPPSDPAGVPPPVASQPPAPEAGAPSAAVPIPSAPPSLIYAALGQTVPVGRSQVTPVKILEDSRCPANARCVWAGQVRLRIRLHVGAGMRTMEITSGKPVRIPGGTLKLDEIRPDKMSGHNGAIRPMDYRFGFGFISSL